MTTSPGLRHFPDVPLLEHPSHAEQGITPLASPLYVVTMLSNPLRWRSRYRNYWTFENHVNTAGAVLYTAEVAFGERAFEITSADNPRHLQLRTDDELWHKENALNHLISRLPADARYVAWVDADVQFTRPDWAQETVHQLQHYDFVQMFSQALDMDHSGEADLLQVHRGFAACYLETLANPLVEKTITHRLQYSGKDKVTGAYWHPGYAWAARIPSLEAVGMLMDWPVLGSADWHMAWGLIGKMSEHLVPELNPNYLNLCFEWEDRAETHIKRNLGCVPGSLIHHFHGRKTKRAYNERWRFLIDCGYDPLKDIYRDRQGLWQLRPEATRLRDGIRAYMRMRDEDER